MDPCVYVVKAISRDLPTYSVPGVAEQLRDGKACIGWSYDERFDLRELQKKVHRGDEFTDSQEKDAWKCHGFLDRVEVGDYLIYPHQPSYGRFMVVQVTGPYTYLPEDESLNGDFRSCRPCKLITPSHLDWRDPVVPPIMKRKMGLQGRFYRFYDEQAFEDFLKHLPEAGQEQQVDIPKYRIGRVAEKIAASLPDLLRDAYPTQDFTRILCDQLFGKMGYATDVRVQEGPYEHGADVIVTVGSPLFDDVFTVGVQAFAYSGAVDDRALGQKLEQLFSGWQHNGLDYGVLLTTGDCDEAAQAVVREHNAQNPEKKVKLIHGKAVGELFLQYLGDELTTGE